MSQLPLLKGPQYSHLPLLTQPLAVQMSSDLSLPHQSPLPPREEASAFHTATFRRRTESCINALFAVIRPCFTGGGF